MMVEQNIGISYGSALLTSVCASWFQIQRVMSAGKGSVRLSFALTLKTINVEVADGRVHGTLEKVVV
jgi:hypothetical protein